MTEFYEYKGNTYLVLGRVKIKDPTSRLWIEGYKYTDGSGVELVREIRDFERKFKRTFNCFDTKAREELEVTKELLKRILSSTWPVASPLHTLHPSHYTMLFAKSVVENNLDIPRAKEFLKDGA